jgi:hypothetical protein
MFWSVKVPFALLKVDTSGLPETVGGFETPGANGCTP